MKLTIQHQESYSRGELLLRTFFGWLYIALPHVVGLYFYSIWVTLVGIYAWFVMLFTTRMPEVYYNTYLGYMRWSTRVNASLMNLVDGYPPFGPSERWEKADLEIGYPTVVTRKRLLFITFLGWFAVIPQIILVYLRFIVASFISFVAFFIVLFTGKYPEELHRFVVETYRISTRVSFYLAFLYFNYPEFDGQETETDRMHMTNSPAGSTAVEPAVVQPA